MDWQKVSNNIEELDGYIPGNLIAVVVDQKKTSVQLEGGLDLELNPDYVSQPLTGTVVQVGEEVKDPDDFIFYPGRRVLFKRHGAEIVNMEFPDGPTEVAFMSVRDVYFTWSDNA